MRPGRALWWRDLYAWLFPWGFALSRGVLRDLFVRVWPSPYVLVIVSVRGVQVSVSNKVGYIMRVEDGEPRAIRTMWGKAC